VQASKRQDLSFELEDNDDAQDNDHGDDADGFDDDYTFTTESTNDERLFDSDDTTDAPVLHQLKNVSSLTLSDVSRHNIQDQTADLKQLVLPHAVGRGSQPTSAVVRTLSLDREVKNVSYNRSMRVNNGFVNHDGS